MAPSPAQSRNDRQWRAVRRRIRETLAIRRASAAAGRRTAAGYEVADSEQRGVPAGGDLGAGV
ncbi:hypothetical protein Q2K19_24820 [Micromonospora soli]|uniref:hypothetical protein n=1 Tax=Micromonospora sp. NBRC 110009 TaxID=3061627 RepID=UPI0026732CC7|nr:hypothetical protein [Micromonospora sp. NBRC 110009]WKT97373.1 hypothetical protein Q2K19_24820 [Micromonospora sp. NBRC 110009]